MSATRDPQVSRILFVCLGNICRSPSAEAVMAKMVAERGLEDQVLIDSAGVGDWHVGESPDGRATQAAAARGVQLRGVARQVGVEDFERFDLIVAMDSSNRRRLLEIAPDPAGAAKVRMMREFEPGAGGAREAVEGRGLDVPDPYHGGPGGFERVLDMLEAACAGLLAQLEVEMDGRA